MSNKSNESCDYKTAALPGCLPLALAYVPVQSSAKPVYEAERALSRGTLFPGLDLPFMNVVNPDNIPDTPLGEVMAIDFVCHELTLYLDTHACDSEAFASLKSFLKLSEEAHRRYTERYGPLTPKDLAQAGHFTWVQDPWPWDGAERSNA